MERNPGFNTGVITVRARVSDGVKQVANVGGTGRGYEKLHTFSADERELLGGTNQAPAPLEYFVAGLNFCFQSTLVFNASSRGLRYDSIETTAKAYFNRRGIYVEGDPSFTRISFQVDIKSPETEDSIRRLIETTEKSCCVHTTLSKAVPIETKVLLNGQALI